MSVQQQESRVDALIRITGVVVFIFGAALLYETYANVAALTAQEAPLVPVYYALGLILLISGFMAAFSKFK